MGHGGIKKTGMYTGQGTAYLKEVRYDIEIPLQISQRGIGYKNNFLKYLCKGIVEPIQQKLAVHSQQGLVLARKATVQAACQYHAAAGVLYATVFSNVQCSISNFSLPGYTIDKLQRRFIRVRDWRFDNQRPIAELDR